MGPRAFQIHPADNVATLLDAAEPGPVALLGAGARPAVAAGASIPRAHKIALGPIPAGGVVVKFGARIGHATRPIAAGEWVHLHNLASDLDERSGALDLHTGAPGDTVSAYV